MLFSVLVLAAIVISYPVALLLKFLEDKFKGKDRSVGMYITELVIFNVLASVISLAVLIRYAAFANNIPLAINAVISYLTGTNLQHFAGETTLTYIGFLASLGLLQWVAPITGMSVAMSLISSFSDSRLGDFLINALVSTIVFALLVAIFTVASIALGIPMDLHALQTSGIRPGPIALINSQTLLGTNGGPYFSSGFYLPLANPNAETTILGTLEMLIIPFSLIWLFGMKIRKLKATAALYVAIILGMVPLAVAAFERIPGYPLQVGNALSNAFMSVSMGTNTGATLVSLSSLTPVQQTLYIILMVFGNLPGSVGTGFVELLFLMMLSIFFVGLMSGRLPYFLGRRLRTKDVAVVSVAFLSKPVIVYAGLFAAIATSGATFHAYFGSGFTAMLWEVVSSAFNNGSDFYGPFGNTAALNWITSGLMLAGRYVTLLLGLYLAYLLAEEKAAKGTEEAVVDVASMRFAVALLVFNFILNILSIFPLLALGPLA